MNSQGVSSQPVPSLALGQIPTIGMVTAPSSGGHVGIGIGIPIMAHTGPLLQQSPPVPGPQPQQSAHHGFVSPDSSEDFHSAPAHSPILAQPPPLQHGVLTAAASWPGPFLAGLGYPLMGMPSHSLLGEGNMYYGLNFLNPAIPNPPGNVNDLSVTPLGQQLPNMGLPSLDTLPGPVQMSPKEVNPSSCSSRGGPLKEIIHCKSCTLFPPNPAAPPPTTRDKPSGCRTVFVGGLPDNMTEDIVREAFEHCGEIATVRMSKKNFCHVRFQCESYVDGAIYLSGYRIRIGSNSDAANMGRFHVDFAQARDDFYEWECRQRQLQREQRHRDRFEQERLQPPSPPPIVHFSEHEATTLTENIKVNEHFGKSVQTLITWLERGDCSKRNSSLFYSMIQSTNSHIKRLLHEKSEYEDELVKAKALAHQRIAGISTQFSQVEKVFLAASHKKAWDHFTKAQRKNIDLWKKQILDVLPLHPENRFSDKGSDEMEFSDSDSDQPITKRRRSNDDELNGSLNQLQEENDSLRCQLEALKNEVDLIKADFKSELEQKDAQITILQDSPSGNRGLNPVAVSPTQSDEAQIASNACSNEGTDNPNLAFRTETNCDSSSTSRSKPSTCSTLNTCSTSNTSSIQPLEAKLVGVISTFLNVHPFGASLDYIASFVQKVVPAATLQEIQSLLRTFPGIFREELSGVGANLERKWSFTGFSKAES